MTTSKIFKRDYLNMFSSLISDAANAGISGYDWNGMNEFIAKEIESLDKKAASAKARAEKVKAEGDELRETVFNALSTNTAMTIREIQTAIGDEDLSAQKITARLTQLVKLERVEKTEVSVKGSDGKSRKVNAYRAIG